MYACICALATKGCVCVYVCTLPVSYYSYMHKSYYSLCSYLYTVFSICGIYARYAWVHDLCFPYAIKCECM